MTNETPHTERPDNPLDQVVFPLDREQTKQILEVLANPPSANEALRKLMAKQPIWEP